MAIEGPLRELGLHDVFQLLDLSRKTGVLRISSQLRSNDGTVYFDRGAVVYAEIRSNPQRLGDVLLRAGKITESDLDQARAQQEKDGRRRRFGRVLVDMGAITERELERQVEFHIEETVFELMSWREGFFSFAEGVLEGLPADVTVRIPVEKLLMEGARRIDEWSRIETHLPHLGVVPSLAPPTGVADGMSHLHLLPEEWLVLAQVDGTRDVRGLASSLARPEFEVAKTLFGLVTTGVITLADPARASSSGDDVGALIAAAEARLLAGDVEPAKEAAQAAAGLRPHDARPHLLLARTHLAQGHWGDAVDACRRALRLDPKLAEAHRWFGYALAGTGRYREARESWEVWGTLANGGADSTVREAVAAARAAAATLERQLEALRG